MAEPNTGDTPLMEGVNLYDASWEPQLPEPQGDTPVEGEVHLVEDHWRRVAPTAGELRKLGYAGVADALADDQPVASIIGDTQPAAGQVNLYEERPAYPGGPAPEEPTVSTVTVEERLTAVPEPSAEENAATSEEERSEAEVAADQLRDQTDPAYHAGRQAAANGEPRSANPYDGRSKDGKTWARGYDGVSEG